MNVAAASRREFVDAPVVSFFTVQSSTAEVSESIDNHTVVGKVILRGDSNASIALSDPCPSRLFMVPSSKCRGELNNCVATKLSTK